MSLYVAFRLKELSDKISKQGLGSPSVLRNVNVREVVIGLSHMAFLLQVIFSCLLLLVSSYLECICW